MSLDVARLPLGALETNCYLVRIAGATEAVVVDPGADVTELRLELTRRGARCIGILITQSRTAADRVLYGSDYPHNIGDMEGCLARVDALTAAQAKRVRGAAARELFGL